LLMRKRGVYFSLLTLAFTQMFFYIVYGATAVTGGENGLGGIERFPLRVGSLRLDLGDKRVYYYASAILAALAIYVLWRVVPSPTGIVGVFQRLRGLPRQDGGRARATTRAARAAAPALVPAAGPTGPAGEVLLEARDIAKHFGALAAVDGVSLRVPRGELRSIIGPNGAGKTTLFNVLTGLLPADRGQARFRATTITALLPHQ